MSKQTDFHNLILLSASKSGATLFRNNTGMGWVGEPIYYPKPGYKLLKNARPLHAGLTVGSSDFVGWKAVTITPEMVGKTVAVFTAIEAKTMSDRISKEQLNFIEQVRKNGGIAGIARSHEEASNLIQNYL